MKLRKHWRRLFDVVSTKISMEIEMKLMFLENLMLYSYNALAC